MHFRLFFVVITLTILLALPRFAHHTPDSPRYINLAKYFRSELPREQLLGPHAYRVLVPFLAAHIPSDNLAFNFALINVLATLIAYLIFIPYLKCFVTSRTDFNVGMLMLVMSFPSLNYASRVLTDPVGFLTFVIAAYLLLKEYYYRLSATVCLGVLARESLLCMVLVTTIYVLIPVPDLKATNSFSRISDSGDLLRISSRLIQIWYDESLPPRWKALEESVYYPVTCFYSTNYSVFCC